ncbi:MAG: hypothetical protein IPP55_07690 [Anaerolineales bacterium]|nr:hypothetical protein [Anaerolineales bacterium]
MMQEKRIVGALQAEQNAKAAQTQAANIAKAMSADVTENERFQVYQEEKRQAALEAQRAAERNAEQIATEYEIRAHEQPMQAYRLGEQNAVEIAEAYEAQVREQTVQAYREGEREAVSIAEQARLNAVDAARWAGVASVAQAKEESEKEKPWWAWDTIQANFRDTMTSREDWMNRAIGALPKVKDAILLAPLTIKKTLNRNGNYLFHVNKKMVETVSTINNGIVSRIPKWVSNIFDVNTTPIPSTKNGYKKWITEQLGLNIQREAGTTIQKAEVMDRLKDYFSREWTDIKIFAKEAVKETTEEAAEAAVEAAAKQAAESAAKANLKAMLPSIGDALVETGFNIYDYTLGSKKDEPDKFQKIMVGSGVDIGGAALTGAAAAGTVALIVAAVVYFVGSPVTVPLTGLVIMTVVIGFFFDIVLESTGVKRVVKDGINNYIDHLQSLPSQSAAKMPYEYEPPTQFPPSTQVSPPVPPAQMPPASPSQTPEP